MPPPKMFAAASSWNIRPTKKLVLALFLFQVLCALIFWHASNSSSAEPAVSIFPELKTGHGGRWHIPHSWSENDSSASSCDTTHVTHIIDAAECALRLALANNGFMNNTRIPLIAHQTARSTDPETWSSVVRRCVERWLTAATGHSDSPTAQMAWLMWDDDGIDALVEKFESDMYPAFSTLPYPVEKADFFRVLVLKWFGGMYGDIDSQPLKHPSAWVESGDVEDWLDAEGNNHAQHRPPQLAYTPPEGAPASYLSKTGIVNASKPVVEKTVNAIFGLEADNLPDPDNTYWRMGYTFPVQITNWALAMAPHHPVATRFLTDVTTDVLANVHNLRAVDPLDITGPPALTRAVKNFTESAEPNFTWQSLSSRDHIAPGGRSKIVAGDILILPITGFSPGRGWYQNMGSQPTDHHSARLQHMAAGSWRRPDLKVTYGKLCRTVFGLCRDWSKIPAP